MKKILIVGIENTCRSIITAEYLRKTLKDKGKTGVEVAGAGVRAFPDIPADAAAVIALEKLGIEGDFKSRPLSKQEVVEASLIITMSQKIKAAISGKFADKAAVIYTLKELAGEPEDEMQPSEGIAEQIRQMIDKGFSKISGE